jgi:hypothetical protein
MLVWEPLHDPSQDLPLDALPALKITEQELDGGMGDLHLL